MSKLSSEMKALAKKAGGSFKTVNDRIHATKRFSQHLRELNIQIQRVEQIKVRHIECYIQERLEQDIGLRTLQNEMAALRSVLRLAGRRQVVEHPRLTNKALGLSGASRNGTRRAITPEHYEKVMENARAQDAGLAAAVEIARLMGLRSQEAVQSSQSLKTWLRAISRGETRLKVVFGTKGGRPRYTTLLDAGAVRKAVENALPIARQRNGRMIDKPDLKTALESWHKQAIKAGLKGEFSPHSLRYAWAQDAIRHYLAQGFSEKESLALTATDLGHGDGRGRWVKQVYGYSWKEE
ncbi:integrase domain-containing protein [Escherichia coli]|uniref:integrase domain-containing protein n=1 Tax=Escherichia coli TaxID=562 RepID=UPI000BE461BF|nr:integrase domain-containing protein [Escherichia coli]EFO3282368.1 DNA-binding protein [Escherichia coli]EKM1661649.1 integrase domain-containing protein [Escherichia coli]MDC9059743.1 integrase domain-containing protein [Escherichia coli]HAN6141935.1 site-specific integrase [Escherichia coli]HBB4038039.1 integrase domain-containing protein [Escherichia coli]